VPGAGVNEKSFNVTITSPVAPDPEPPHEVAAIARTPQIARSRS
jgi:hypothetical protein